MVFALDLAVVVAVAIVGPTGIELERLIDNTVQLPGTTEPIRFDGPFPVPCGDGVLFKAFEDVSSPTVGAYYVTSSGVEVVVDEETMVSGSGLTFLSDFECSAEPGFTFLAADVALGGTDIYHWQRGSPVTLVQEAGIVVDGRLVEHFIDLSATPSGLAARLILDEPGSPDAMAMRDLLGNLELVAVEGMVLPGQQGPATGYGLPLRHGSELVFKAATSTNIGAYRWTPQTGISLIVDNATPLPGGLGTPGSIGLLTRLATGIVFEALYSGGQGLFLATSSGLEPLIIPGSSTTTSGEVITSASRPSGAGHLLSFMGTTDQHPLEGVFARLADGRIVRILSTGDVLEGVPVVTRIQRAHETAVAILVFTLSGPAQDVIYRAEFPSTLDVPALSHLGQLSLVAVLAAVGVILLRQRG